MQYAMRLAVVLTALVGISAFGAGSASAQLRTNMNFEGLPEGLIVSSLASGSGIAGDTVAGSVEVFGDHTPVGDGSANAAMVYDAACHGGGPADCSGREPDKFAPKLGRVLTIGRSLADANGDGLADAPDTAGSGGELRFDFRGFGTGSVTITSLDVLDVESGGWIKLFARGVLVGTVAVPATANNGLATVAVGYAGIDRMEVRLKDSGVIDNIRLAFAAAVRPPQADCGSLRLSVRSLARARRSIVWARVRDTRGVPMAGVRVVARGAGVRTSRITNARGLVRFLVRPQRAGVVRFAVPASSRCAKRVIVRGAHTRTVVLPALVG
jgi:hypothetical protein